MSGVDTESGDLDLQYSVVISKGFTASSCESRSHVDQQVFITTTSSKHGFSVFMTIIGWNGFADIKSYRGGKCPLSRAQFER